MLIGIANFLGEPSFEKKKRKDQREVSSRNLRLQRSLPID